MVKGTHLHIQSAHYRDYTHHFKGGAAMSARRITTLIFIAVMLVVMIHMPETTPVAMAAGPSIYWGALVGGQAPTSTNLQAGGPFATFETRSKKKMAIIHWGQPWMMSNGTWGDFQT